MFAMSKALSTSGCFFQTADSQDRPGLKGHPVRLTPRVQTQSLTGTPSLPSTPLAPAPQQRQFLLFLPPPLGNVTHTVHAAQLGCPHREARGTKTQTKNADCSDPELCLVQTYPDFKRSQLIHQSMSCSAACCSNPNQVCEHLCDVIAPMLQVTVQTTEKSSKGEQKHAVA